MGLLRKPVLRGGPEGPWRLPIVAIYSLNHSAIGKTTHASGTAAAHVRYITRIQAKPDIVANLVPENRNQAQAWMNAQEASGRKNARVCDKIILALPLELTPPQRIALLRDFADQITEGRAPYFAAIHAAGKDARNPHAHLILVDRDKDTGKRVMLTTDEGVVSPNPRNFPLQPANFLMRSARRPNASSTHSIVMGSARAARREFL